MAWIDSASPDISGAKTDRTPTPSSADPTKYVAAAADWNKLRLGAINIRDWIRGATVSGAHWYGLGRQAADPAPVGIQDYLWLSSAASELHCKYNADDYLITMASQTAPTIMATGDILAASSSSGWVRITTVAVGQALVSGGVGALPAWSASPSLTNLTLTGLLKLAAGAVGAPSVYLSTDTTTGLYRPSANQLAVAISGAQKALFAAAGATLAGVTTLAAGAVGAPSLTLGDATTGLYRSALDQVAIAAAGAQCGLWSATGLQVTGKVGVGVSPTAHFHARDAVAGSVAMGIENTSADAAAYARVYAANGTTAVEADSISLTCLGTGYTTAGGFVQDAGALVADTNLSGGLSIMTRHASGDLRIYTGGHTNLRTTWAAATGNITHAARLEHGFGADVASGTTVTLGSDGNAFNVTGNTQIDFILTTGWQAGSVIDVFFASTPTVRHNNNGGGTAGAIMLAGSADLSAAANTRLQLVLRADSGDANALKWWETSRTVA